MDTGLIEPPSAKEMKLVEAAADIREADAGLVGEIGFSARLMCQVSLPYREPKLPDGQPWIRRNGDLTLAVHPAYMGLDAGGNPKHKFAFGLLPRLIMIWVSSEVCLKQSPTLDLGPSLRSFMLDLGLDRGGQNMRRLKEQIERLAGSRITVDDRRSSGNGHRTMRSVQVADGFDLWWVDRDANQAALFDDRKHNKLHLSDQFFQSVLESPVPIDLRALRALRGGGSSGLAIDLYMWLAHRMCSVSSPTYVKWEQLESQFGSGLSRSRDFRAHFRKALEAVRVVYPGLKVDAKDNDVIVLHPSPTSVQRRAPKRNRQGISA